MVSRKGKRKLIFEGQTFYWQIQKNDLRYPEIVIVSEDKSVYLKHGFDREISIGPEYIKNLLKGGIEDGIIKLHD